MFQKKIYLRKMTSWGMSAKEGQTFYRFIQRLQQGIPERRVWTLTHAHNRLYRPAECILYYWNALPRRISEADSIRSLWSTLQTLLSQQLLILSPARLSSACVCVCECVCVCTRACVCACVRALDSFGFLRHACVCVCACVLACS